MEVLLSFHAARVVLCSEASGHRFLFLRQQKCSSGSPRAYITECRQNNETVWKLVIWPGPQCTMVSVRWLNCGSMICSVLGTVEAPVCVFCFRVTGLAEATALLSCLWLSITLQFVELHFVYPSFSSISVSVFTVHVHQSSCVVKGFCAVWHLDAFSSSSSARTHRRYITPLFYVMTAAALRLYLPSRVFPAPRPRRRPASFTIPASCKRLV